MIAQYTETLKEYLENQGGSFPQDIESLFSLFPTFDINYGEQQTKSFNMKDLFVDNFEIREIGAESEELFAHYLKDTLNRTIIEYVPRIKMFISNYENLYSRVVTLQRTSQLNRVGLTHSDDTNKSYLNPVNNSTQPNLKIQSQNDLNNTSDISQQDNETTNEDRTYGYFKSNPEIMSAIFKIKNQYIEALGEFEKLFIGLY